MEVIDNLSLKSGENIELIKVGGDKTNKTILIIGVFHGEEPQGYFAIQRYLKDLSNKKLIRIVRKKHYLKIICLIDYDIKNSTISLRDYKPKSKPIKNGSDFGNAEQEYNDYLESVRKREQNH